MVDLAYVTQGAGEVIGSHEYHVHAGDVKDLVQILHSLPALGLQDHRCVLRLGEVFAAGHSAEARGADEPAGAAGAHGRELGGGDGGAGLLCRINLRDHDGAGPHIQGLINPDVRAAGDPDYRAHARHIGGADQMGKGLKGGGAMLHIQQHEVIAGIAGGLHKGRVSTDHEGTQSAFVGIHGSLEPGHTVHSGHIHRIH